MWAYSLAGALLAERGLIHPLGSVVRDGVVEDS